jgi:hypothetical protein
MLLCLEQAQTIGIRPPVMDEKAIAARAKTGLSQFLFFQRCSVGVRFDGFRVVSGFFNRPDQRLPLGISCHSNGALCKVHFGAGNTGECLMGCLDLCHTARATRAFD